MKPFKHENYGIEGDYNVGCWRKYWYEENVLPLFPTKEKVLDVGCGNGRLNTLLKTKFKKVIGIEIFDYEQNFYNFYKDCDKLIKASFEDYSFKQKFDAICFFNSFYQMEDKKKAFDKAKRLLTPSGFICIVDDVKRFLREDKFHYNIFNFDNPKTFKIIERGFIAIL